MSVPPVVFSMVRAGDITLAVDVLGEGAPVLFIHGFPLDRTLWRQVAGTLTGWRRILPDLRGFGRSAAPEGTGRLSSYTDDLIALLDTLDIQRSVVAGLSMGGYVALDLVRRYPDRVRGLVLANTRAAPDDPDGRDRRDAMIARIHRDGPGGVVEDLVSRVLAPSTLATRPQVTERVRSMMAASTERGLTQALEAMRDRPDARDVLPAIGVRTLVVAGSEDAIVPVAEARAMAAGIPGAQLTVVPDAGHLAPVEQPISTSRVIGEFLGSLPQE